MVQRAAHVVGAAVFAVTIPRLMGPALFGRYALLMSVSMWFALLSGMGAQSMLMRTIPRFMKAGDTAGFRKLVSSLLALRFLTGSFAALSYVVLLAFLIREADWVAVCMIAVAVLCRTAANVCFVIFLGLNNAARWGVAELLRRWVALALVPVGFLAAGLRGACAGYMGTEVLVLVIGLVWAAPHLERKAVSLDHAYLRPFLRTGTYFAAGSLMLALTQRSGETLVRFATGRYEEVAYFGAAYAIYLTAAHALAQLPAGFAPHLIALSEHGRHNEVRLWIEKLLTVLVIAAVLAASGMALLGPQLIPLLLGPKYRNVVPAAIPLMLSLLPALVGNVGRSVALAQDRPKPMAVAAGIELALFWGLGLTLASRWGSVGAAWAPVPASLAAATFMLTVVRRRMGFSLAPAATALGMGTLFVALWWLRGSLLLNIALFAGGAAIYAALLFRTRVVTMAELRELWTHVRGRGTAELADA
jgi:O-antigen/teichoic acid export membrane protein